MAHKQNVLNPMDKEYKNAVATIETPANDTETKKTSVAEAKICVEVTEIPCETNKPSSRVKQTEKLTIWNYLSFALVVSFFALIPCTVLLNIYGCRGPIFAAWVICIATIGITFTALMAHTYSPPTKDDTTFRGDSSYPYLGL